MNEIESRERNFFFVVSYLVDDIRWHQLCTSIELEYFQVYAIEPNHQLRNHRYHFHLPIYHWTCHIDKCMHHFVLIPTNNRMYSPVSNCSVVEYLILLLKCTKMNDLQLYNISIAGNVRIFVAFGQSKNGNRDSKLLCEGKDNKLNIFLI